MDAAREHLWGQLLSEQNLVESQRLGALVAERDERIRGGQDCSLGQLLVQKRVLDVGRFQHLRGEIEGRGRACFQCRNVFLAPSPAAPYVCPHCGGPARLPPPTSGQFPAAGNGSDRHRGTPGSGGYPPQGPAGSGRFATGPAARPGSGPYAANAYPGASANAFVAPAGTFGAQPGSGGYPSQGVYGSDPSGRYPPPAGTGVYPGAPRSGHYPQQHGYTAPVDAYQQPRIGSTASAPDEFDVSGDFESGELGVGKRFGNYEIVGELGRGGMGVVYKAVPIGQPGRSVAIKVLLAGEFASEKLKERFKAESELSQRLDHPNIVPVFDVGEVDGLLYYAMGYVEGQELQDMIRAKSLPIRRGVEILVEVCHAAHHAHQHGVVHRDLKPSNVLVSNDSTPYIMDFGLAKNLEADKGMTKSGIAIGTPYYMPPEQARGSHREMDARSDVYALGAILYEIATRRVPFTAKTQNELLRKIIEEEPTPLRQIRAGVPADLETVCLKCLCKEKTGRYDSALDLAEDLERFLAGEPIKARREAPWSGWIRKMKRNRTQSVIVVTAVVAVLAAIGIIGLLHNSYQTRLRDEAERQRIEDEKRAAEEAEAERLRLAQATQRRELDAQRQRAERAITSGQDAYASARAATSYSELLRALERAEAAFNEAVTIESKLSPNETPRPSTAYRRGLVRRLRCSWEGAIADFVIAADSKSHRARGNLAAALVQLRQMGDADEATRLLRAAAVAEGVSDLDEGEESSAQEIALAYLAYMQGDYASARGKLSVLIDQAGLGSLSGEANGALAYFERERGKPLGGDVHAGQGLRAANKAVTANKFRYDFLVDRAILLARSGRRPEALTDQRAARNLDVDGAWAELADAVINSLPNSDRNRRKQAIESATAKAQRRGPKALGVVQEFIKKLQEAASTRDELEAAARTIASNRTATMNFNGGGQPHVLELGLKISADTQGVLLTLSKAVDDIDLFVGQGKKTRPEECEHHSSSPSPDETILLRRQGDPPMRVGSYTIFVVQPPSSRKKTSVQLTVRFLKAGEPEPFVWEDSPRITLSTPAGAAEANRLIRLFSGKQFAAWKSGWMALEKREPLAKLIRVKLLAGLSTLPPELATPAEFEALSSELPLLARRYPQLKTPITEALATAEVFAGKVEEGLSRLRAATEQDPRKIDVHIRYIHLLNRLERYDEAAAEGERVLALKGGEAPLALLAMARTQIALGDLDEATKQISAAVLSRAMPLPLAAPAVHMLIENKRFDAALSLINALSARTPGTIDVNLEIRRAFCIAGKGDKAAAIQRLRTHLANVPPGRPSLTSLLNEGIKAIEDESYLGKPKKPPQQPADESSRTTKSAKKKRRR